jgi:hypothetical protein
MLQKKIRIKLAVGGVVLALSPVAWAANPGAVIEYTSQTRSVAAVAAANDFSGVTDSQNSNQSAPDFNPFAGYANVTALVGSSTTGPTTTATALQNSTLGATSLEIDGSVTANSSFHADGSGNSSADSLFQVTFTVPESLNYVLTTNITGVPDMNTAANTTVSLDLSKAGTAVFDPSVILNDPMQTQGVLTAGTYQLLMTAHAASDDESLDFIDYTVDLTTTADGATALSSINSNDTSAVPLPPASWSALTVLAGLALASGLRRKLKTGIMIR